MKKNIIIVTPYNPSWSEDFQLLKQRIITALGNSALSIEHVGSTAVEGMSAKPIIDIDVIIEDKTVFTNESAEKSPFMFDTILVKE